MKQTRRKVVITMHSLTYHYIVREVLKANKLCEPCERITFSLYMTDKVAFWASTQNESDQVHYSDYE